MDGLAFLFLKHPNCYRFRYLKERSVIIVIFFKSLVKKSFEDNIFNGAAALAFYWFLALFPLMILILGLVAYIPIANLDSLILGWLESALPGNASELFQSTVQEITGSQQGGLITFGAIASVFVASMGFQSLIDNLNFTYRIKEGRSFWKARLVSLTLLFAFVFLSVGGFCLLAIRDSVQGWVSKQFGSIWVLSWGFEVFRWGLVAIFIFLSHALIYFLGPDIRQKFLHIIPGSLVSSILFILGSIALQFYIERFADYSSIYGSLGTVIALLLWLNLMGIILLLGSEVNVLLHEKRTC